MPYYPTHEAWTRVSLPPTRQPRYNLPNTRNLNKTNQPTNLRQTTLVVPAPTPMNHSTTCPPNGRGRGHTHSQYHHHHHQGRPLPTNPATSTNAIQLLDHNACHQEPATTINRQAQNRYHALDPPAPAEPATSTSRPTPYQDNSTATTTPPTNPPIQPPADKEVMSELQPEALANE